MESSKGLAKLKFESIVKYESFNGVPFDLASSK